MVGLNVGQAKVKFSQVWSQVFPLYLQIGEALTPMLVKWLLVTDYSLRTGVIGMRPGDAPLWETARPGRFWCVRDASRRISENPGTCKSKWPMKLEGPYRFPICLCVCPSANPVGFPDFPISNSYCPFIWYTSFSPTADRNFPKIHMKGQINIQWGGARQHLWRHSVTIGVTLPYTAASWRVLNN